MRNIIRQNSGKGLRPGFTMIELLISIMIFVIFLSVVSSAYISIIRSQKQENEVRKMYTEVRNVVDILNQEIRLSSIDYDCYNQQGVQTDLSGFYDSTLNQCSDLSGTNSLSSKTSVLLLVNKNGLEKTTFKYDGETGNLTMKKYSLIGKVWTTTDEEDLFSGSVKLESFAFRVFPSVNPYSSDKKIYLDAKTQFQPKVTITMSATNAIASMPDFHMDFQTTISSRVYNR